MDAVKNGSFLKFIEKMKAVINCSLKFRYRLSSRIPWSAGYSQYKFDYISNAIRPENLSLFESKSLPKKYGYRLDERVVEYPWFFSKIDKTAKTILDAGSVLNFSQVLNADILKDKDLYISTLYFEGRPHRLPSPSYIYEDLRSTCFRDNFFDAICSLSTLEHVGLDNTKIYTPDIDKCESEGQAYLEVIKEFSRIIKPGGRVYISVPYGMPINRGWFQVFNHQMLDQIEEVFKPKSSNKTYFKYSNEQWNFAVESECREGECFDLLSGDRFTDDFLAFSRCVVCLELEK